MKNSDSYTGFEVAVIGMSGKFPGANNIHDFWENIKKGLEPINFYMDEELLELGLPESLISNPNFVRGDLKVEGKNYFDSSFFDFIPDEAKVLDPQVRIFFECVWEALEDAGYNPFEYDGMISLFAGAGSNVGWEAYTMITGGDLMVDNYTANHLRDKDFLTTRISYKLDLRGPSFSLDTACSTSLVAIHVACQSLITGESDMAIAGGITINCNPSAGYFYIDGMIMSPDGHCRAFDADAHGTVGGEGAGVVVLKMLENSIRDNDNIYAVIKGSAINNDGIRKVGYTAPAVEGQYDVIRNAQYVARVPPESIGYIEAHGTGTILGDPIEFEALHQVFGKNKNKHCALGTVKTNIGHLDRAAGVAGFIKTVLALKNRQIPPSLHFVKPNPKIDIQNSPFYVITELKEWENKQFPLRAGVSSFGIGGTNVHVVLEEAPQLETTLSLRKYFLLPISGKSAEALDRNTNNLLEFLKVNPDINIADAAFTLQAGRVSFEHRRMLVCADVKEAVEILSDPGAKKIKSFKTSRQNNPVIFMFPGQGAQYAGMGLEIYEQEPVFREEVDRCFKILNSLDKNNECLKDILYPASVSSGEATLSVDDPINRTEFTQPLLFIFEYALAKCLMNWDIRPDYMIGHSIGEYVAACISGVLLLEDALKLVILRGKLIQGLASGSMLSVSLKREELQPFLNEKISLAAVNSSESCVLSGRPEHIDAVEAELTAKGYKTRRLFTSHAFHSDMMDPILERYKDEVVKITIKTPQIPYLSNVTGEFADAREVQSPVYWCNHIRRTVRFCDGAEILLKNKGAVFIEVGPGKTLGTFIRSPRSKTNRHQVVNLIRHPQEKESDQRYLLNKLGELWLYGIKPDWQIFHEGERRRRISLPSYSFEKIEYPLGEDPYKLIGNMAADSDLSRKQDMSAWFYVPYWKRSILFPGPNSSPKEYPCNLVFGENSALGKELVETFERHGQVAVIVKAGQGFSRESEFSYMINPESEGDYSQLFEALSKDNHKPERIIHLWSISGDHTGPLDNKKVKEAQAVGFYSLLHTVKAMFKYKILSSRKIIVVTNYLHQLINTERVEPEKSPILGLLTVIPQEYPSVSTCSIDIPAVDPVNRHLVDNLYNEICFNAANKHVVYRDNQRWVQGFEKIEIKKDDGFRKKLKEGGVYLITGGLGNLGHVFAKYLIEKFKAKIMILGHRDLPPREEWEKTDAGMRDKIGRLKELEAAGGQVLYFSGDIADIGVIESLINEGESKFGSLNGVIHAAGITKGPSINAFQLLDEPCCEEQFRPKIYGLLALNKALENKKLDFCLVTSSLSGVLGGMGFAAYAAANIFMDHYIGALCGRPNNMEWISINFDGIDFSDEAFENPSNKNLSINRGELIDLFERILLSTDKIPQLVVSTVDLQTRIDTWVNRKEAEKIDEVEKKKNVKNAVENKISADRPEMTATYIEPVSEYEKELAKMWQAFFGISHVGVNDDFFELGGDSLKAMTLIGKIHRTFDIEISLPEFFNAPTIKDISKLLIVINRIKNSEVDNKQDKKEMII